MNRSLRPGWLGILALAADSVVRFASMTLRPSTDSATATRPDVGLERRIVKFRPRRAST